MCVCFKLRHIWVFLDASINRRVTTDVRQLPSSILTLILQVVCLLACIFILCVFVISIFLWAITCILICTFCRFWLVWPGSTFITVTSNCLHVCHFLNYCMFWLPFLDHSRLFLFLRIDRKIEKEAQQGFCVLLHLYFLNKEEQKLLMSDLRLGQSKLNSLASMWPEFMTPAKWAEGTVAAKDSEVYKSKREMLKSDVYTFLVNLFFIF